MHFKKYRLVLFLFVVCFSCKNTEIEVVQPQIIPAPDNLEIRQGNFLLSSNTKINAEDEFQDIADLLSEFLKPILSNSEGGANKISFIKDETIVNPEGYSIEVNPIHIEIKSSTKKGAFYAFQTLRQLLPEQLESGNYKDKQIAIQALQIYDWPQFQYRGMHLDVARHMYSVDFIKKYIDAMAMLKMNTFHWHLTDDQGWRVEIEKYPKLNTISSFRDETLIRHYNDQPQQFDGKRYGGFYTKSQIKDIVSYAEKRMITVIPEIEMPGHSQAVIAAYPELGCASIEGEVEVAKKWGVFENIYCTKDETFNFLEDILDEVLELFPSKYIHIGGDEAPKTSWKTCKNCQSRIASEGLKDEHQLQNYFITRMEKYLNSKGRQIIGWDEILEGGLAPNATVMSWRGTKGAIEAAKSGHNVVMTPTSHCYFDYYQSDNEDEPMAIGGYLPLEKVYGFNPIPGELNEEESKFVLGSQGNVWTEYMQTGDQVEYMAFPRILAMAEVNWTSPERKNYEDFIKRLEHFHKRLDVLNFNYANHLHEIDGSSTMLTDQKGKRNLFYQLETLTTDKTIRYTIDGKEPTLNSEVYTSQIPITESATIKAAVFNSQKQFGKTFSQTINYHKAVGAKITIDKKPHKAYSGSGAEGLINGISGSDSRYGDKEWLGFWGDDILVTIEFEKPIDINTITTRFYNVNGQWIYAPKSMAVTYYYSDNASTTVKQIEPKGSITDVVLNLGIDEEIKKVNKIILWVKNYGTIPEGKQGAGNKAWTFIDEIIVN